MREAAREMENAWYDMQTQMKDTDADANACAGAHAGARELHSPSGKRKSRQWGNDVKNGFL